MKKNEREIEFNVDAYTARLIGRENVSKVEGAVLEILKNAYDADARMFCFYFNNVNQCVYILDNGTGMKEDVLINHWMTIGNSSKKSNFLSKGKRIQTGAKGIGRFALDRLSDKCSMLTVSEDGGLEWIVNWNDFADRRNISDVKAKLYDMEESPLEYIEIDTWKNKGMAKLLREKGEQFYNTGTVFKLEGLRDEWNEALMIKLKNDLENLLPPNVVEDFSIYFFSDETDVENAKIENVDLDSFDYKIDFSVNGQNLNIKILRNEFDFKAEKEEVYKAVGFSTEEQEIFDGKVKNIDLALEEIGEGANLIGNFGGILYFNKIAATVKDTKKFYYKDVTGRKNFTKDFGGIKLYRDHFRVRPYGEYGDNDFDWLELSARRNRSPAGLGHTKGVWRVGAEQMLGTVSISRNNDNLEDAANRNGIQEGAGLQQLKHVLLAVINEFERDRQSVGRCLAEYAKEKDRLQAELDRFKELAEERKRWEEEQKRKEAEAQSKQVEKEPEHEEESGQEPADSEEAPTVDPQDVQKLLEDLGEKQEQEIEELESELKMIQTLATTGILTNMFMHEIRTLTNNIGMELDSAFEAIKYDNDIQEAFENVNRAIEFKKHFASWFGVTIESIKKDKRTRRNCNISDELKRFLNMWKEILKRKEVELFVECDTDIIFRCHLFDLENIFSNLLSNSMYSFEKEMDKKLEKKEIYIKIEKKEAGFLILYKDTGWGLTARFKKRPELILEAFESERKVKLAEDEEEDGTGMGMWIVHRTIAEYSGAIDLTKNMTSQTGFETTISLGGKYV